MEIALPFLLETREQTREMRVDLDVWGLRCADLLGILRPLLSELN